MIISKLHAHLQTMTETHVKFQKNRRTQVPYHFRGTKGRDHGKESWNVEYYFTSLYCENVTISGPRREKTCLRWFANNKGADQPAHPRSPISAFVIRLLKSTISRLATSEISIF